MACGIYKITNKINGLSYIGQSTQIEKRWKEHIWGKGNQPLHKDLKQYGISNFIFEILELCQQDELLSKEKKWIKYYGTFQNGYNLNDGGDNHEYAINITKKKIFCYDLNGNFIQSYESLSQAERDTKIPNSNISRAAKNNSRAGKFQWRYSYEPKINPYKRQYKQQKQKQGKAVEQYDQNMNYIATYVSALEAERKTGVDASGIGMVCNGQRKTAGKYIWRFKKEVT